VKRGTVFQCLLLMTILLAGCQGILPRGRTVIQKQIDEAETKWLAVEPGQYYITVDDISLWHWQTYHLTVVDGAVTDHAASCTPAPIEYHDCEVVPYDPEEFTIPGLFLRARSLALTARENPGFRLEISFNPDFHFPRKIVYGNPRAIDSDGSVVVQSFTPVE
jgi:hypothetical protein